MYTLEQVAKEIEQLKPDFTELFRLSDTGIAKDIVIHIQQTSNTFERLLKAEVILMLHNTHANKNIWSVHIELGELLRTNLLSHGIGNNTNSYNNYSKYMIHDSLDVTCHIAAHLKDPRPYLPKYLWDRIRVKRKLQIDPVKVLQPDGMSLTIFQRYLQSLKKPLSSIDARNYLKQIRNDSFQEMRQDFMSVIFEKCTKPSIDLQKDMSGNWQNAIPVLPNQDFDTVQKYMTLSRNRIRNLANTLGVPVSPCIYDARDSEYKPFITNMYRIPDTTMQEVSYLFNVILILQVSISKTPNPVYEYFIEHISKHLATSESSDLVNELKQSFTLTNEAFSKFTI